MSRKFKSIVIFLILSFWPFSLLLNNTPSNFLGYLVPGILVALSFLLYMKNSTSLPYLLPIFSIPFAEPKLAALPLIFILTNLVQDKEKKKHAILLLVSLVVLTFTWNGFWGQTIFRPDHEAEQLVIGKTYIYDSVVLARVFQNKPRIYLDKLTNNFFALTDPNNYFFNFHPREILIDNQNLIKFPSLSIVFALFGFYYINKFSYRKFMVSALVAAVLSLSVLTVFDRNDFVLWFPISAIVIFGAAKARGRFKREYPIFSIAFLIFSVIQLLRIFID